MSLLGGLGAAIGGLLGFAGQESANDAQMEMLERQIEWQKEVLQNKIQWNVEDMRAAGLNPVLSVMGSGGASGSAPTVSAPQVQNPVQAASNSAHAVSDIIAQFRATDNDTRRVENETQVSNAQSAKLEADTRNLQTQYESGIWHARTMNEYSSAFRNFEEINYLKTQQDSIVASIDKTRKEIELMNQNKLVMLANIEKLKAETRESGSRTLLNEAERQYKVLQGNLVEAQTSLSLLESEGKKISNQLQQFNVPEAEVKAEFYRKRGNRFMLQNVPGWKKYFGY